MKNYIGLTGFIFLVLTSSLQSCKKDNDIPLSVSDIEGNFYSTIVIGDQVWTKENLKTTKYNDGESIPLVTDAAEWSNLLTPGYCWYDNNETDYKDTYGALYNWYAVSINKLCPSGWHVPTDEEWSALTTYLGGESVAGGKLKEAGITNWADPNVGATNESGFTALPAGYRGKLGNFNHLGSYTCFWSTSEFDDNGAWFREVYGWQADFTRSEDAKTYGFSVRCIKD